jgi:hypothetical protein
MFLSLPRNKTFYLLEESLKIGFGGLSELSRAVDISEPKKKIGSLLMASLLYGF